MRRLLLIVLALACAGPLASSASADSYCVAPITGCAPGNDKTTLSSALGAADAAPGDDDIFLGADLYDEDGLAYDAADDVTIHGVGPASSLIAKLTSANVPVFNTPATSTGVVRFVDLGFRGINVQGGPATSILGGSLEFDNVTVSANPLKVILGVSAGNDVDVSIVNSRLSSPTNACLSTEDSATIDIADSELRDCAYGVQSNGVASNVDVHRTKIIGSSTYGVLTLGGHVSVEDSLIAPLASAFAAAQAFPQSGRDWDLTIRQSTIVGTNAAGQEGIAITSGAGTTTTINPDVTDTIVTGFPVPVLCSADNTHKVTVNGRYNALNSGAISNPSPADCTISLTNTIAATPVFTNAGAEDYSLVRGSNPALIDVDTTALSGESATDLARNPRFVDGARDIGAYEVQALPVVPPGVPPAAVPAFTGQLKFSKNKVKKGKKVTLKYALTTPAVVAFKLTASKKKNKVPKLASAKAGATSYSLSTKKLKPGKYKLTATPAGGVAKSASFTVKK